MDSDNQTDSAKTVGSGDGLGDIMTRMLYLKDTGKHPAGAKPNGNLQRFRVWMAQAKETCLECSGVSADEVPAEMWLHYYEQEMRSNVTGSLIARIISA